MTNGTSMVHRARQHRTAEEKLRIVEETLVAGASVSVVARRHEVNANQVFGWRRQYRHGELGAGKAVPALIPLGVIDAGGIVSAVADLPKPNPAQPSVAHSTLVPPVAAICKPAKMIEVELRSGTRIRIDGDIKGSALQQVLKLIRSLA